MSTNRQRTPDAGNVDIATDSPEGTIALGRRIGKRLTEDRTFLLFGDLGSGKTAFCQGLARGLGVPDSYPVTSPTFSLINEYPARLPYYHVDLYRLPSPVDPDDLGLGEIFEGDGIVAVEWADRLHERDRPPCRLELFFAITGKRQRAIRINGHGLDASNLVKGIDTRLRSKR